ncbi:XdhC family protein, partial [Desulfovibrio sp. OttesenSCG-928-C14]|nr:XdhC family protein [Desulfovibrio sp. OttesenSCG-928-C14]
MKHYFQTILAYLDGADENSALATATIIDSSGSAPRTAGARMLIFPDGSLAWTIGGGRYEAEARALALEALEALQSGAELPGQSGPWEGAGPEEQDELKLPALALPVSLRGSTDMDMICGGNVVILLELIRRGPKTLAFFR